MTKKIPDKIVLSYKELMKEIKRLESVKREKFDILKGGMILGKKGALLEICKKHLKKYDAQGLEKSIEFHNEKKGINHAST